MPNNYEKLYQYVELAQHLFDRFPPTIFVNTLYSATGTLVSWNIKA